MKLLSTYIKEMKIASRGFYFYIEIFMAVIILTILLVAVKENPESKSREYFYYDMPQAVKEMMLEREISAGNLRPVEATEVKLKPISFETVNEDNGETIAYDYDEETILALETYEAIDPDTGRVENTILFAESEEELIRIIFTERRMGATIRLNDTGQPAHTYYLQGFETERLKNLLYIINNASIETIMEQSEQQTVRKLGVFESLNNRENILPAVIVFMGSLMGFFIIMSYIFLDKAEGVIRAFAVTPSAVWKYLLSKLFVILTTVIISTSIIVIPIMWGGPNYLMLYVFLIATTFAMGSLGLLVASFFDTMTNAFGVLYGLLILFMLPGFSFFIPSFDPLWLRFFPTYSMLHGSREILLNGDMAYVGIYSAVFLAGGIILFMLANIKFKKTLTV